jgi:hypothetical protein
VQWQATLVSGADFGTSANVGQYWEVENSGGGCLALLDIAGGGQAVIT